jgi:hypothetical protein
LTSRFLCPFTDLTDLDTYPTMKFSTAFTSLVALATSAVGQSPTQVNDFVGQPTRLRMYTYVPKTLTKPAPILVAVHHCQGSAQQYSTETRFQQQADKKGFIIIYPNSKSSGGCFDVASTASKSRPGDPKRVAEKLTRRHQLSRTMAVATARPSSTWSSTPSTSWAATPSACSWWARARVP